MKSNLKLIILFSCLFYQSAFSQDPNLYIYLCFGQSNMEGAAKIEADDTIINSRLKLLSALDCPDLGRIQGQWYDAKPPLCRCNTRLSPVDYFGKTMIANLPDNVKIGLVHVAVAGSKIEIFDKEKYKTYLDTSATAKPWMIKMAEAYGGNPYQRLVDMAKIAQKAGVIKGILLHQGESNTGDQEWPSKVKKVYDDLLSDLDLRPNSIPLLAGEVVGDDQNGLCASMNKIIAKLPLVLPRAYIIPSIGLPAAPDRLHFNSEGVREFGKRYAGRMLSTMGINTGPFPAGTVAAETNAPGFQYPRVDNQRKAYFKLEASGANTVQLDLGKRYDMSKDHDGLWQVVTDPLQPGFHYYFLWINGVRVADPASESFFGTGKWTSGIEIPTDGEDFFKAKQVPHGEVRGVYYFSKTMNQTRRCFIYTPPGYDASKKTKYPVLYLQHGMAEDETGWSNQGHMNYILDNLIAEGKAKPMLVVMESGNIEEAFRANPGEEVNKARNQFGASFGPMLLNDLIPMVESRYKARADKGGRAMAGLSWGGFQTLDITFNHRDKFEYIGSFSGALFLNPETEIKTAYHSVFADPVAFNKKIKLFFLGIGSAEGQRMKALSDELTKAGIHNVYYESPNTAHEWHTWRRCLYQFAPLLFK
jgi:enterochelin esterase-like enzyme